MREGLAQKAKRVAIGERKGREMAKGHRKGDTALGCHGYQKAAD